MPFGSDDRRTKNLKAKWKDKDLDLTFFLPETGSIAENEEQRGSVSVKSLNCSKFSKMDAKTLGSDSRIWIQDRKRQEIGKNVVKLRSSKAWVGYSNARTRERGAKRDVGGKWKGFPE